MRTYSKQWRARSVLAILVGVGELGQARAGVVTYTDRAAFLNAFPQANLIDFDTLPDGSPSYFHAEITPLFNYTDQGVEFSAQVGVPYITGNSISGFNLTAGPMFSSEGPPNWLIVDFATPARALGFTFGGDTTLSLFTPDNEFLGTWLWGGGGEFFLGAASNDRLIASAIINAGLERQTIGDFYVIPVPEPGSLALLAFGGLLLARRAVRNGRARNSPQAWFRGRHLIWALPVWQIACGTAQAQPVEQIAINLHANAGWEINTWNQTLNSTPKVLPYIWIPLTEQGKVVRIATSTFDPLTGNTVAVGDILGTYWTAPEGCRVLQDEHGWVALLTCCVPLLLSSGRLP